MPASDPSAARFFEALPDPRRDRTRKHARTDVLVVAPAAPIAGAAPFEAVAACGDGPAAFAGGGADGMGSCPRTTGRTVRARGPSS